jgi:hypothetical protein
LHSPRQKRLIQPFVRKSAGAATQKGQKFLLIVDFMANLSDAFFAARSNSKRPRCLLLLAMQIKVEFSAKPLWCQMEILYICEPKRFRVCLHWEQSIWYSVM